MSPPVVINGEVWVPTDEHLVHLDSAHGWKPGVRAIILSGSPTGLGA